MKSMTVHRSKLDEVGEHADRFRRAQMADREMSLELVCWVIIWPEYRTVTAPPDEWAKVGGVRIWVGTGLGLTAPQLLPHMKYSMN